MTFGNGSHSLKRGFLRPNGGSRLPAFLIIGLVAGCSFLLYNVYTTTVDRNSLIEELSLAKKKWQSCQRDKTELETRFETHVRSFKTMKDDLERLRALERNSNEIQKELKLCREQIVTLQNENSDLKEEQKTDVESCQRKLKTAEEKLDPCMQEKSRMEEEINGLRSNLSTALQQAQLAITKTRIDEGQHQTNSVVESRPPALESENNIVPPVPPHRGAPIDPLADSSATVKKSRTGAMQRDDGNSSIGGLDGSIRDKGQIQTTIAESATSVAVKAQHEAASTGKNSESAAIIESRQPSNATHTADTSVVQMLTTKSPDVKSLDAAKKQEFSQIEKETNGTSRLAAEPLAQADEAKSKAEQPSLVKRKKQKQRRLNKVIEEGAPAEEKRRLPADLKKEHSRGEQDDAAQPSDSERVTLRAAVPKRMNIGGRPGLTSDHELKTKDRENDGKDGDAFVASVGAGGTDMGLGGQKDGAAGSTVSTIADLKNQMVDDHRIDVGLAPPIEKPLAAKPKADIRKGLKDDYQYTDDDDADAIGLKNRHKKTMGNERNSLADTKNDNSQHGSLLDLAKAAGDADSDTKHFDSVAMKKEAKLAMDDQEQEKNMPKDADTDIDSQN